MSGAFGPRLVGSAGTAAATMRLPRAALVALAIAGVAFGIVLADEAYLDASSVTGVLDLAAGWSFIGVGLYAWARRPSNRIGPLMTATGFLWLVTLLGTSSDPAVFAFAGVVHTLGHATALHLLLVFPSGRLETPAARLAAKAIYAVFVGGNLLIFLVSDPRVEFDCPGCPRNVLQVVHSHALAEGVIWVTNVLAAALVAYVVLRLLASWRRSHGWRRRALTPVVFSGAATALMLTVAFLLLPASPELAADVWSLSVAVFVVVPYAYLLGLARTAVLRGDAVGELVARLVELPSGVELRDALRHAIGDPALELAYWLPERDGFADADGRRIVLPSAAGRRLSAGVELDGRLVGAIIYDGALVDDPDLVRATGGAVALAMEKQRLDAELRAKVEQLRASRERLVEAGFEERRRLERNLHDGAQQRFVSLALSLQMARSRLGSDAPAVAEMLDSAARELALGLDELRELARGIHPAILSDRGLGAAIGALAARVPFEVQVDADVDGRLPEKIEVAAYYVVSEALANATKHARASRARVLVTSETGCVTVEISDDGVGGADQAGGSGLRGLSDRVAALDGGLDVISAPGGGTIVRARIPCSQL
jgi:signal transduction histidine kinase